ncbi:hypothetical protein KKD03_04650 [Patescibacteria group bacterium]|nr:hypothetical protein [Patescibacteria group bacterium]
MRSIKRCLNRIHKGLYSTVPISKLDKYELGCAVSGQLAYVSAETILQNSGIIVQDVTSITLFGKKKKQFEINGVSYLCRHLNQKYLLNRAYIDDTQRFSIAMPERAVADILNINPRYYFDNQLAINLKKINNISRELGYI